MPSPPPEPLKASQRVRKACDSCRARKVRCDGDLQCTNCQLTNLHCTYMAIPKKKGPKGRRTSKDPSFEISFKAALQTTGRQELLASYTTPGESTGKSGFQISPLISVEMIHSCLDAFFAHKYPLSLILSQEHTYSKIRHLHDLPEQYSLTTALCAVIVLQPEIPVLSSRPGASGDAPEIDSIPPADFLINESCRASDFYNHVENPSLAAVQASFFLFAAFFSLGKDNSAWFYLRQSMTILQLLRLHEETTYSAIADPEYSAYCRRTFWLLFITERAYAIQRHRPLTLQCTISLPTVDPGPEATTLSGFLDLIALFRNFDNAFLSLWNLSAAPTASTSPQSLAKLQDVLECAIPDVGERTQIQQADLLVTRLWLKNIVWQLCVSKGLLSSKSANESMSFHYPVTIARDVILVSKLLRLKAFEAHGVGILEKFFDIGCSLADVLLVYANFMQVSALEIGPRDCLVELVRILGTVLGGSSKYLRLLAAKADECLQVRLRGSLSSSDDSCAIREIDFDEDVEDEHAVYGPAIRKQNSLDDIQEHITPREWLVESPGVNMTQGGDSDYANVAGSNFCSVLYVSTGRG